MDATSRAFSGPMVVVTWVVAVGWLALAAYSFFALAEPIRWVLGGVSVAGALGTGWLASSLRIPYDDEGLRLPRRGHVRWDQVDSIDVTPGPLSVPVLSLRSGRMLEDVYLDGLAWFGGANGLARTLAEKVARTAGVDAVGVRGGSSGTTPGRAL